MPAGWGELTAQNGEDRLRLAFFLCTSFMPVSAHVTLLDVFLVVVVSLEPKQL